MLNMRALGRMTAVGTPRRFAAAPNFGSDRREADMTRASWACRSDEFVEGFGCRPLMVVQQGPAAGVRKPSMDETAGWVRGRSGLHYGDLSAAAGVRECGE